MSSETAALAAWQTRRADPAAERRREVARARRRGLLQAAFGLLAGGLVAWRWRPLAGAIIAGVGVGLALLAWLAPRGHAAVEGALRRFGSAVGAGLARVLLAAVTVGVFWPLGALLRARRRLRITTGFDPAQSSYWTPAAPRRGPDQYRRPF